MGNLLITVNLKKLENKQLFMTSQYRPATQELASKWIYCCDVTNVFILQMYENEHYC